MNTTINYRAARERLANVFALLDHENAGAVFEYQLQIIEEIRSAESETTPEAKLHVAMMRVFGDALAHRLLSTHALRQLVKNKTAKPPSLKNQGKGFQDTVDMARSCCNDGSLILFADITNIIKIGDFIVCDSPDIPDIVECKSKLQLNRYLFLGRRRRQLERSFATVKYLKEGHRQTTEPIPMDADQQQETRRILAAADSEGPLDWEWSSVQSLLTSLNNDPITSVETEPGAGLSVCTREVDLENVEWPPFVQRMRRFVVGCHTALFFGSEFYPPPLAWPLPLAQRIALMEQDFLLLRHLDLISLQESFEAQGLPLAFRGVDDKDHLFEVTNPRPFEYLYMSHRPARDIIFGYQTINSAARFHAIGTKKTIRDAMDLIKPVTPETLGVGLVPMQPNIKDGPGMIVVMPVAPSLQEKSGSQPQEAPLSGDKHDDVAEMTTEPPSEEDRMLNKHFGPTSADEE